jgi:thymidylate kinase/glycosyltransferase involved in cell wall biosynthesis
MKKISIGVCLKNEQSLIIPCLESLYSAIVCAHDKYLIDLSICFNGTTDNSKKLVDEWIIKHSDVKPKIIVLENPNLVEAQRVIVEQSSSDCNYFGFFDADVIVDEKVILLLVDKLEKDNNCIVAYAQSIPLYRKKETLIEKAMNLYDYGPSVYSKRKYLHGRVFITKDWFIPQTNSLLCVDDIYLSFYYLTKYGSESICKVPSAKVMFHQLRTFKDYFKVYRRRNIEVNKCLTLYPEFSKLPKDQINRDFVWIKFWESSVGNKSLWILLFILKFIAKCRLAIELFWSPLSHDQWESSLTSKRTRTEPIIILIEGLDCSGKKTLARCLHNELTSLGIPSELNLGPLGPFWYKKLSQIVSLNRLPNFIRTIVYTFEIIIGSRRANKSQSDIVIQVSSVLRAMAYSSISNDRFRCFIFKVFSRRVPKYNISIYLTTDYENRKNRHIIQVASRENSDDIEKRFKTKEFFEKFEIKLLEIMNDKLCSPMVFNTNNKKPEEITKDILEKVQKLIII